MAMLDEAALQLADSLPVEVVPAKLRCASCNKLAANAVKLPCCDQSICELCSRDLPETCPICSHSPLSSEDCKPDKKLRMTVKAFIKSEEKKRSKESETPAPQPTKPATPAAPVQVEPIAPVAVPDVDEPASVSIEADATQGTLRNEAVQSDATRAVKATQENGGATEDASGAVDGEQEYEEDEDDDVVITTERPEHEMQQQDQRTGEEAQDEGTYDQDQDQDQSQMNGQQDFGFGQNQQSFNSMDFGNMNNFNPMMAMQNGMGMPNFGMGMPNMMGMPGMNMDPSMMFNGGFGGMGGMNDMSMMNMGMGMGNMGGFGAMPGVGMNGGGGGPGFFPGNGGYNQQNFGSDMHQNFNHNRGYGGRPYGRGYGRGRGWGGYNRGRGGWQNQGQYQQGQNQNFVNQQPYQQRHQSQQIHDESFDANEQQGARRGSPVDEPMKDSDEGAKDASLQPRLSEAENAADTNNADGDDTNQAGGDAIQSIESQASGTELQSQPLSGEQVTEDSTRDAANMGGGEGVNATAEGFAENGMSIGTGHNEFGAPQDQQSYDEQYQQGNGYGSRGRGGFRGGRGGFRGRGGAYGYVATPGEQEQTPAPPVNAPTGPKAMRAALPNSGWYSRPAPAAPTAPAASPPTETARPKHQTRERSRSVSQPKSDRHSRNDKYESREERYDECNERRSDRDSRKRKERDRRYEDARDDEGSSRKDRSRSESPDHGHTSKRRHRDRDDDGHSTRSHRDRSREKRKHRHRSRSPARESSVNGDGSESVRRKSKSDRRRDDDYKESDRVKDREKSRRSSRREEDHGYESKDRSSRSSRHGRSSRDERDGNRDREHERDRGKQRPVLEEPQDDIGFKIKGSKSASMQANLDTSMGPPTTFSRDRSHRRTSVQNFAPLTPTTPAGDPYAEEREKRQRERLDRENTLRRQSTTSLGKRLSRDEDELEAPTGPKGDKGRGVKKTRRKIEYKYEDEIGDDYDESERRRWK
ncbi:hypothetical protein LTR37_002695 [Vermiconidia calcicola]|uniref:Uncharacterized protein n=1 Tax=Vermiconidia calcicola TaxID=1690605 RepID=A0ACC3NU37_9PEZI|nr:hypothetical protein LTR37_002695 [Vermiconidia calcicola]